MELVPRNTRLINRAYWLVRLRWIAIVFLVLATFFATTALEITVRQFAIYCFAFILAIYNLIIWSLLNHVTKKKTDVSLRPIRIIINCQICLDLLLLTVILHFSGGIENPFIFFFIFHMIIASILLSVKESYFHATFASVLIGLLLLLEYLQIIGHYCLEGFIPSCMNTNKLYVAGTFFVFITALYLVVYMTSYIAVRLRRAEEARIEANEQLLEKDRIKDEYVQRVTHDIKGHLAAIQSCLDVVARMMLGPLNEKQAEFINRADNRTRKLTAFVRTLLKLTRMRLSSELPMYAFSLNSTVSSSLASVEIKANDKTIAVKHSVQTTLDQIFGNEFSIEEVITNMLLNAIKYTPENGTVELNAKDDGDFALFEISDTGIGIPADEVDKVFDEFYRASNAKKIEKDGTGLGLSIVKQIVERHHGKIWVESRQDYGSTFSFTLPKTKKVFEAFNKKATRSSA
jgi:signal transduction histidine kinase